MKALILNCTLKPSPEASNTQALAEKVAGQLREHGVTVESVRVAD
jgi:menaquinone-dependent protoporphyrinogen IX oxidase